MAAMVLHPSFFEPFDRTWDEVSGTMNDHFDRLSPGTEKNWLGALIKEVKDERDKWLNTADLETYIVGCSRLKSRFLRLMVATYLHISYDLPRVLADNWPNPTDRLLESSVEYIYFDLSPVFPDVLKSIVRQRKIVGAYNKVLIFVSRNIVRIAAIWLMLLREAAWRHGRSLAAQRPRDRANTERRMLKAMTAALDEVCNRRPWSAMLLSPPPNMPVSRPSAAAITILGVELRIWLWTVAALITLGGIGAIFKIWRHGSRLADFVDELGRLTYRYVDLAVNDPEGFERELQRS